jgi:hypothetical protein
MKMPDYVVPSRRWAAWRSSINGFNIGFRIAAIYRRLAHRRGLAERSAVLPPRRGIRLACGSWDAVCPGFA